MKNTNIEETLAKIVSCLKGIRGVSAIVLGGSRATRTAEADSDIDIGIYYHSSFDLKAFQAAAIRLDDEHREDCVTEPGEWGPWINGGGWLTVNGIAVDLLFRDLQKVSECITNCINGELTIDYQCGHPFGFVNSIYMGEVSYCKILWKQTEELSDLKAGLSVFPQSYKQAVIRKFLWECEFSLTCGQKGIKKQDVLYASGSLFRCAVCLIQVLYAYNEMYCLNEKGALKRLHDGAAKLPDGFCDKLEHMMLLEKSSLEKAFAEMESIFQEVRNFVTCEERNERA